MSAYIPRTFVAFRLSLAALLLQAASDSPAIVSPALVDAIERLDDVTWEGSDTIVSAAWHAYECCASERGELPRGSLWERELASYLHDFAIDAELGPIVARALLQAANRG